jgi:putative ATPase
MQEAQSLFTQTSKSHSSLAERIRPEGIEAVFGQQHLLSPGKPLYQAIQGKNPHSMILWGPPGCGKTTIAKLLSQHKNFLFIKLSAVLDNLQNVRSAIQQAKAVKPKQTILFIDEVHRFNKSQQDAFLPHIEDGTIIFVGATTENPSFEINRALLSRCQTYTLKALEDNALEQSLANGKKHLEQENKITITFEPDAEKLLISGCNRDARRLLNVLELSFQMSNQSEENATVLEINTEVVQQALGAKVANFDKGADIWYDQISALHKSVRGSSPDGALYWCCRMLAGGCDPLYIARRLLAIASEDVGNADPRALPLALSAWQTYERLGAYEGERAIAHACIYLACAPKSNAIDVALKEAKKLVQQNEDYEVPLHLRNAPTKLMKDLKYGEGYRYAHNEPDAYASGESYFPKELEGTQFYKPTERGLEIKIKEKLQRLKQLDQKSSQKRW